MAPHSSSLAWRIPWTEEPVALQSMGSLGVVCPFSPPDRDRRVDSPALSARASDLPGAPKDEAGLIRKFETSHVGGAKS